MQFMGLTEYGREVHAEMDALVGAARSHVSVKGCTMYCTTFPCHMCAQHIVASGIVTLVFIEPYPKSHAKELFADSISVGGKRRQKNKVVFKPYIGIAPSQYMHLFKMDQRKHEETGRAVKWNPLKSAPRRWRRVEPVGEQTSLEELHRLMKKKGLDSGASGKLAGDPGARCLLGDHPSSESRPPHKVLYRTSRPPPPWAS